MTEDLGINDSRWRDHTYLDYVGDTGWATPTSRPHLGSIARVRFAPDQPQAFAEFAGRFADLGITKWEFLFGLASTGVRVPDTEYVLRVVRPWYAYFEKKAGEFPTLPPDWLEHVRLVRCPGGGIEWLGRQHPMAQYCGLDLSGLQETQHGWKCKSGPAQPQSIGPLIVEIAHVVRELHELSKLLTNLAARAPQLFPDQPVDSGVNRPMENYPLADWEAAIRSLMDSLNAQTAVQPVIFNADQFRRFFRSELDYRFTFKRDGCPYWLRWHIGRLDWNGELWQRELPPEYQPQDLSDKEELLAALKKWMLGPQTRTGDVWNALFSALPVIADADPEAAWRILDVRLWRKRILANSSLTEVERQYELSETYGYFNYILNNALLHVLPALANNHFLKIERFLRLPSIGGSYTGYIPAYLFAVLYAKTQVLTDLRLCGGLMGPTELTPWEETHEERCIK